MAFSEAHVRMAYICLRTVLEQLHCSRTQDILPKAQSAHACTYAARYWVRHMTEPQASGSRAVSAASHLLQDHVLEWLDMLDAQGALSEVLGPMAQLLRGTAVITATDASSDFDHLEFEQNIRAAMRFIRLDRFHGSKPSDSEADEPLEGQDAMTSNSRLRNNLLFAPTADSLRQRLIQRYYPWLSTVPLVSSPDTSVASCCLHIMQHDDWVRACHFSPDGRLVASASDDGLVHLWNVETGKEQVVLGNMGSIVSGYVYGVAISETGPDDHAILAADGIGLWDVVTGRLMKALSAASKTSAASSGMSDIVEGQENSGDGEEEPPELGDPFATYRATFDGSSVDEIVVAPTGDRLAAVVDDEARLWSLEKGFDEISLGLGGRDDPEGPGVGRIRFSPDGKCMAFVRGGEVVLCYSATGAIARKLRVGRISDRREGAEDEEDGAAAETEVPHELPGLGHPDAILELRFSPNSTLLLTTSLDATARIYDLNSDGNLAVLKLNFQSDGAAFSNDGTQIATTYRESTIALRTERSSDGWGRAGDKLYAQPQRLLRGHGYSIRSLHFSPTRNLLASSSTDCSLRIWDLGMAEDGVTADGIPQASDESKQLGRGASPGHAAPIRHVSMSTDQSIVASVSIDGRICFWDGITGNALYWGDHSSILWMAFSPDASRLVSVSKGGPALLWDLKSASAQLGSTITPEHRLVGHTDWVRGAAFSHDGRLVATASDDGTVRLWDISAASKAAEEKRVANNHKENEETANVMGEEETKHAAVPVRVFSGHSDYVYSVAFSPGSTRLASAGDDRRILIWDLPAVQGQVDDELHKEKPDKAMSDRRVQSYLRGLLFSPDGNTLFSVALDATVAVWRPDLPDGVQCLFVVGFPMQNISWFSPPLDIDERHPDVLLTAHSAWPFDISPSALQRAATAAAAAEVDSGSADPASQPKLSRTDPVPPSWAPFAISSSRSNYRHILWNGRKLVSLPRWFLPADKQTCLVRGRTAVVGCDSGDVLLFRFSEDMRPGDVVKPCGVWLASRVPAVTRHLGVCMGQFRRRGEGGARQTRLTAIWMAILCC